MEIELLSAVRPAYISATPAGPTWPCQVPVTASAWVKPGDSVCVTMLTMNGASDCVELPWGQIDPVTEELDFLVWSTGQGFARRCLVPVAQVRQSCDAEGASGWVAYKPRYGGNFAGVWVLDNPHGFRPMAFKLLTVPAGRDLSPYCTRQPILIPPEGCANWLNPSVSTARLQQAPPVGTFDVLEFDEVAPA